MPKRGQRLEAQEASQAVEFIDVDLLPRSTAAVRVGDVKLRRGRDEVYIRSLSEY